MMTDKTSFRIVLLAGALCAMILPGCNNGPEPLPRTLDQLDPPVLTETLRESLEATGSVERWSRWSSFSAAAVTTVYEENEGNILLRQAITAEGEPRLGVTLITRRPEGAFSETIDPQGHVTVLNQTPAALLEAADEQERYASAVKLRLLLHALSPATLLNRNLDLRYVDLERKGGRPMHKIEVAGDLFGDANPFGNPLGDLLVVWIDDQSHHVRRLWLRYKVTPDEFEYLLMNVNRYEETATGLSFPTLLELVRSDQYQQESVDRIFTSELRQLQAGLTQP